MANLRHDSPRRKRELPKAQPDLLRLPEPDPALLYPVAVVDGPACGRCPDCLHAVYAWCPVTCGCCGTRIFSIRQAAEAGAKVRF